MGTPEEPGLIPNICKAMFTRMEVGHRECAVNYFTNVSYLEIYNEKVKDLLSNDNGNAQHALKVRNNQEMHFVEGLSTHSVSNYDEILVSFMRFYF